MRTSTVEIQIPDAESVTVTEDTLSVDLSDGRTLEVPLAWFPIRANLSPNFQILLSPCAWQVAINRRTCSGTV